MSKVQRIFFKAKSDTYCNTVWTVAKEYVLYFNVVYNGIYIDRRFCFLILSIFTYQMYSCY